MKSERRRQDERRAKKLRQVARRIKHGPSMVRRMTPVKRAVQIRRQHGRQGPWPIGRSSDWSNCVALGALLGGHSPYRQRPGIDLLLHGRQLLLTAFLGSLPRGFHPITGPLWWRFRRPESPRPRRRGASARRAFGERPVFANSYLSDSPLAIPW
jgi:hypothetical protein